MAGLVLTMTDLMVMTRFMITAISVPTASITMAVPVPTMALLSMLITQIVNLQPGHISRQSVANDTGGNTGSHLWVPVSHSPTTSRERETDREKALVHITLVFFVLKHYPCDALEHVLGTAGSI
jgi:hypothetical protein